LYFTNRAYEFCGGGTLARLTEDLRIRAGYDVVPDRTGRAAEATRPKSVLLCKVLILEAAYRLDGFGSVKVREGDAVTFMHQRQLRVSI